MKVVNKSAVLAGGVLLGLATAIPLKAQVTLPDSAYRAANHSSSPKAYASKKGYWDLHTDYEQLSTTVRFYEASNQLIHQEDFPGQYIKLTRRNTKVLDQVLDRLLTHAPVRARIAATHFPQDNRLRLSSQLPAESAIANAGLTFAVIPVGDEKVMILFTNPRKERITVRLDDEKGNALLHDISTLAHYQRNLVLDQLPAGLYRLSIRGRHQQYVRSILVRRVPARTSVRLLEDVIQ